MREKKEKVNVFVQPLLLGGEYAAAWQEVYLPGKGRCLFLSVGSSYPLEGGKQDAIIAAVKSNKDQSNSFGSNAMTHRKSG